MYSKWGSCLFKNKEMDTSTCYENFNFPGRKHLKTK